MDFVLKDPRQKTQEKTPLKLPHRQELDIVPKPWTKSVITAYSRVSQLLFVTNPTLNAVLNLWYRSYSSVRLVNAKFLLTHDRVFELPEFQGMVMRDIEGIKNLLLKK